MNIMVYGNGGSLIYTLMHGDIILILTCYMAAAVHLDIDNVDRSI